MIKLYEIVYDNEWEFNIKLKEFQDMRNVNDNDIISIQYLSRTNLRTKNIAYVTYRC